MVDMEDGSSSGNAGKGRKLAPDQEAKAFMREVEDPVGLLRDLRRLADDGVDIVDGD